MENMYAHPEHLDGPASRPEELMCTGSNSNSQGGRVPEQCAWFAGYAVWYIEAAICALLSRAHVDLLNQQVKGPGLHTSRKPAAQPYS